MFVWPISVVGQLDITQSTIDGGGGTSTGGSYELSGTIGQPDAGQMSGGSYALTGGFWIPTPPGDCDGDGDVDLRDFEIFEACITGPSGTAEGDCRCSDLTHDGTVAFDDFAAFAENYTGP